MQNGCSECKRLWDEYVRATHEYFALNSKLELAKLAHRHGDVSVIGVMVETAATSREKLRVELHEHEATAHKSDARADDSTLRKTAVEGEP
jgi:hypothetical protein